MENIVVKSKWFLNGSKHLESFEQDVNRKKTAGWTPIGGVYTIVSDGYIQYSQKMERSRTYREFYNYTPLYKASRGIKTSFEILRAN